MILIQLNNAIHLRFKLTVQGFRAIHIPRLLVQTASAPKNTVLNETLAREVLSVGTTLTD